jgi:UDP-N-acetylglucosamine 2-epimerase (non-hydrolysing)
MSETKVTAACRREQVVVAFGTRPEAIKLATVLHRLGATAHPVHSGQHFSPELAAFIHRELDLPEPHAQFATGGGSRGQQIGHATELLDAHFASLDHPVVVVQGDTNTALAAALAANARELALVHIEAGLRSHDRSMPEEHNRVVIDHLADVLCAPTEVASANLIHEGIDARQIVVTGNTVVDAVRWLAPDWAERQRVVARYGTERDQFVLATFHRPENADNPERLAEILQALGALPLPVVFPIHPRTMASLEQFQLASLLEPLHTVPPLGYREFLGLISECALVISDSGGIQEEASVLKRPVIVVRRSTERPEILGTFGVLTPHVEEIPKVAASWLRDPDAARRHLAGLETPYGDGDATGRTVRAIERLVATDRSRGLRRAFPGRD